MALTLFFSCLCPISNLNNQPQGQLQEQLEAVKREYHQRVAVLKEQAQQAAQEAVAGQVPEDERRRIRCGDNRMVVIDDIVCGGFCLSTVDCRSGLSFAILILFRTLADFL